MPAIQNTPFFTSQDFNITPNTWTTTNAQHAAMEQIMALDASHAELISKVQMATAAKKKPVSKFPSAFPEMTHPVIPENNPDGTKMLWKTRYDKLESRYGQVLHDAKNFESEYYKVLQQKDEYMESIVKLDKEIKTLKMANVDSEVVQKRMDQVCKELGIQLPPQRFNTMEQRLNAFFGAIWVRLRAEVVDDQLAE